jgi:hypothetical protein
MEISEVLKFKDANKDLLPELFHLYNLYKNKKDYIKKPPSQINYNEKLYSSFICILNKLSDSNFNDLAKDLLNLQINKEEQIIKLIELIISKATTEIKYSNVYAKLSKQLSSYYIKDGEKNIYFREILIVKCQALFNNCLSGKLQKDNAKSFIIFLGELYNNELLSNKIILSCFSVLFNNINDMSIILICTLIKSIKDKYSKICADEFNIVLKKLNSIKEDNNTNTKDKFMIMDLFDACGIDQHNILNLFPD